MINLITIMEDEKYLRQISKEVNFDDCELESDIKKLKEFLDGSSIGYALASIQIGIPKRIVCIKSTDESGRADDDYKVLINPKIISMKGKTEFWEACFSCGTSNMGLVERPYAIKVEYYDEKGNKYINDYEGFVSTVLCHEIDHLDGIFHLDRAKDFDTLDLEDRIEKRKNEPYKIYSKEENFEYVKTYPNKNIWGTKCKCGYDVFAYVSEHPWMDVEATYTVTCLKCGLKNEITRENAETFYNDKIFECFKDVKGRVLEIGCGGGFLTEYLHGKEDVSYVCGIDLDGENNFCDEYICMDINDLDVDSIGKYDYVVCRDVLMYLDDLDDVFSKLSKVSDKVVLLNWYNPNHKNCHNKTCIEDVFKIVSKYYKELELEYPVFYKQGYLIRSV